MTDKNEYFENIKEIENMEDILMQEALQRKQKEEAEDKLHKLDKKIKELDKEVNLTFPKK